MSNQQNPFSTLKHDDTITNAGDDSLMGDDSFHLQHYDPLYTPRERALESRDVNPRAMRRDEPLCSVVFDSTQHGYANLDGPEDGGNGSNPNQMPNDSALPTPSPMPWNSVTPGAYHCTYGSVSLGSTSDYYSPSAHSGPRLLPSSAAATTRVGRIDAHQNISAQQISEVNTPSLQREMCYHMRFGGPQYGPSHVRNYDVMRWRSAPTPELSNTQPSHAAIESQSSGIYGTFNSSTMEADTSFGKDADHGRIQDDVVEDTQRIPAVSLVLPSSLSLKASVASGNPSMRLPIGVRQPAVISQPAPSLHSSSARQYPPLHNLYCPRRLIDISDGADFIIHMNSNPIGVFQPSVHKLDTRTKGPSRPFKLPIGEQMILAALRDPVAAANGHALLDNDDDKSFCLWRSVAAPKSVGLPECLSNIEFTLAEGAAYFIAHFAREAFLRRLCRAGMMQGQIKSWFNYFRQLDGASMFKGTSIGTPLHKLGKMKAPDLSTQTTDFSVQAWSSDENPINYPLLLLDLGVIQRPQGEDAGPLTRLIVWCRENHRYHTLLSEVPALLAQVGISNKIARPTDGSCPDRAAFARWKPTIEQDRVQRAIPAKKAFEAANPPRRRRTGGSDA